MGTTRQHDPQHRVRPFGLNAFKLEVKWQRNLASERAIINLHRQNPHGGRLLVRFHDGGLGRVAVPAHQKTPGLNLYIHLLRLDARQLQADPEGIVALKDIHGRTPNGLRILEMRKMDLSNLVRHLTKLTLKAP